MIITNTDIFWTYRYAVIHLITIICWRSVSFSSEVLLKAASSELTALFVSTTEVLMCTEFIHKSSPSLINEKHHIQSR